VRVIALSLVNKCAAGREGPVLLKRMRHITRGGFL
jgi:hypothetical protein